MFDHWAQPVVSKRWALACTVLDWLKRASGYRLFAHSAHRAWERAIDLDHLDLSQPCTCAGCSR